MFFPENVKQSRQGMAQSKSTSCIFSIQHVVWYGMVLLKITMCTCLYRHKDLKWFFSLVIPEKTYCVFSAASSKHTQAIKEENWYKLLHSSQPAHTMLCGRSRNSGGGGSCITTAFYYLRKGIREEEMNVNSYNVLLLFVSTSTFIQHFLCSARNH